MWTDTRITIALYRIITNAFNIDSYKQSYYLINIKVESICNVVDKNPCPPIRLGYICPMYFFLYNITGSGCPRQ